jgi:excinuclease ABC subunit B
MAAPKMVRPFKVHAAFEPAGDQPEAIAALAEGIEAGERYQTLLGITGSGKSATVAWMIEQVQRPTLVLAPNKSLAAQLANEYREFFPDNRVEYFVSYYDYYQPEAYIASSDTFIEKDSSVNDDIDRLRHSATSALLTRRDVIVVASVSCIYGLGSPEDYARQLLSVRVGESIDQRELLGRLVDMQYERNDLNLVRGKFRVRGDVIEIHPAYEETAVRIELFGDEIETISIVDPLTGERVRTQEELEIFPATHYATPDDKLRAAIGRIETELQASYSCSSASRSCSRPNGCACAPSTTSRCSTRWGSATASRTTRHRWRAGHRAIRPTRCSTSFPTTTSW